MQMPNIRTQSNFAEVYIPDVGLFTFSYGTLIAFVKHGEKQVVRENDLGPDHWQAPERCRPWP